jgi:anaerobic magnesium-protoporphyrin IX monomethyl ester cyclase
VDDAPIAPTERLARGEWGALRPSGGWPRQARVALVGPEVEENLALRYLASALETAGIGADIVPFDVSGHLSTALESILGAKDPPTVVALSLAFQWRAADFLALAVALRERGYRGHITAGGHFGSFAFREVLKDFPELDSICLHEAERTLPELTQAVLAGRPLTDVAGLALPTCDGEAISTTMRSSQDLATLPWPDRRGEPITCLGQRLATLVSSRGCYAACAFCCIAAWHRLVPNGRRFRLRAVEDVADEMAWLQRKHGIEIFLFHDDNFFLPTPARSLERIEALAEALDARGVRRFATVVKARSSDVTHEVFRAMQERLGLIRLFLGIESNAPQGLATLGRGVTQSENESALRILRDLGIFVCFNLLIFDPDTALESLEANLAFMESHADMPFNFGRVELYAGTPLLARMQSEGRCHGDYLGWDYHLASGRMERIFAITRRCFAPRNFEPGALANRLMGTRFDVEVCARFFPEAFRASWLETSRALSSELALDSIGSLRAIVRATQRPAVDDAWIQELAERMRTVERVIQGKAERLEATIRRETGAGCQHVRPRATRTLQSRAVPAPTPS